MIKQCSKCRAEKSLSDFGLRKTGVAAGKYSSECKRCKADYMNAYYRKKEQEQPGYMRKKYNAQRETKYGITSEEYDSTLERQGGTCAICNTDTPRGQGSWHVDHDHSCCPGIKSCGNCIRGLLCAQCNIGLGALGDDPDRLISAATYLLQRTNVLT